MEKLIAKDLLSIQAVFFRPEEPFTWASGIKSPVYTDNRLTLTAPEVRTHVEEGLAELIRKNSPDVEVMAQIPPNGKDWNEYLKNGGTKLPQPEVFLSLSNTPEIEI